MKKSAMASAAGTSRSALDEYESGRRIPRFDTLTRAVNAAGYQLAISLDPIIEIGEGNEASSLAAFVANLTFDSPRWAWRALISDFVSNEFVPATAQNRSRMLAAAPALLCNPGWDAFMAALAEHLAFHGQIASPDWTLGHERFQLQSFWWPAHGDLPSTRAAALAHSPASFKRRRILVDGRELPRMRP